MPATGCSDLHERCFMDTPVYVVGYRQTTFSKAAWFVSTEPSPILRFEMLGISLTCPPSRFVASCLISPGSTSAHTVSAETTTRTSSQQMKMEDQFIIWPMSRRTSKPGKSSTIGSKRCRKTNEKSLAFSTMKAWSKRRLPRSWVFLNARFEVGGRVPNFCSLGN